MPRSQCKFCHRNQRDLGQICTKKAAPKGGLQVIFRNGDYRSARRKTFALKVCRSIIAQAGMPVVILQPPFRGYALGSGGAACGEGHPAPAKARRGTRACCGNRLWWEQSDRTRVCADPTIGWVRICHRCNDKAALGNTHSEQGNEQGRRLGNEGHLRGRRRVSFRACCGWLGWIGLCRITARFAAARRR